MLIILQTKHLYKTYNLLIYNLTFRKMAKCIKCKFEWSPRLKTPKICPSCKTKYWNRNKSLKKINSQKSSLLSKTQLNILSCYELIYQPLTEKEILRKIKKNPLNELKDLSQPALNYNLKILVYKELLEKTLNGYWIKFETLTNVFSKHLKEKYMKTLKNTNRKILDEVLPAELDKAITARFYKYSSGQTAGIIILSYLLSYSKNNSSTYTNKDVFDKFIRDIKIKKLIPLIKKSGGFDESIELLLCLKYYQDLLDDIRNEIEIEATTEVSLTFEEMFRDGQIIQKIKKDKKIDKNMIMYVKGNKIYGIHPNAFN